MKKIIVYMVLLCSMAFMACGDFLEEYSQNQAYVEKVVDLDELLIGEGYWPVRCGNYEVDTSNADMVSYWSSVTLVLNQYFVFVHLMDDDATEYLSYTGTSTAGIGTSEKNYVRMKAAHAHHWQPDPLLDANNEEIEDKNWSSIWSRIAAMNSVIYQVGELRSGEDDQQLCDRVEGEARFLRAQYYFWMANLYGQPYRKATAATDLCIPLKTTGDIEDRLFSRATEAEVYGQMVADLEAATVLLRGVEQNTKYRTNQAAFALLSRVHLYMENYEAAIACADSVLKNNAYELLDLNAYKEGSAVYVSSPEVIFTHAPNMMCVIQSPHYQPNTVMSYASCYTSSDDLMACFDEDDLRRKAFFIERKAPGTGYMCVKTQHYDEHVSDFMAIRLPEVYLNKAEALALLGRDADAIATVQELRSNRFATPSSITASGDELVNFIRDERRRELCFEGHRWFDLRRYAVNSVCPFEKSITHVSLAFANGMTYTEGYYVLNPYSQDKAAYVLPIPTYAIEFNEGNLTNEVRPQREMIVE